MSTVICIGRQYGSGGHMIGKLVSERLGISYYDKELLTEALENTDLPIEGLSAAEERLPNSFYYTTYYEGNEKEYYGMDANTILFKMQAKLICEKAKKGDCIVVGRCADVILSKLEDVKVLSLFITAPTEKRIARIMDRCSLNERAAASAVRKTDKKRKAYYDFYTGKDWGKASDYDLTINSARWGIEGSAALITNLYKNLSQYK